MGSRYTHLSHNSMSPLGSSIELASLALNPNTLLPGKLCNNACLRPIRVENCSVGLWKLTASKLIRGVLRRHVYGADESDMLGILATHFTTINSTLFLSRNGWRIKDSGHLGQDVRELPLFD